MAMGRPSGTFLLRIPPALHSPLRTEATRRGISLNRELAFCGSEDLTPSELDEERDGRTALEQAEWVFRIVRDALA